MIEMIAFDADDTLWHAEILFQNAQQAFEKVLSRWKDTADIQSLLYKIEMRNIPEYGYGVKAFMISMIEASLLISNSEINGSQIEKILEIGRSMMTAELTIKPDVVESLQALSTTHRMMIITKGDLLEQNVKVQRSGLAHFFSGVEVVSHKTPDAYQQILEKYQLDAGSFVMVGDSLRSDILPVLNLGGIAIHIPANTIWAHEKVADFDTSHERFFELAQMSALPELISRLS